MSKRLQGPKSQMYRPEWRPEDNIVVDIVGLLPIKRNGNKYILTIMDFLSPCPVALVLKETLPLTIV